MAERVTTSKKRRYEARAPKRGSRILVGSLLVALGCTAWAAGMPGAGESPASSNASTPSDSRYSFTEAIANLRRLFKDHRLAEAEIEGKRLLAEVEAEIGLDSPEALEISSVLVSTLMTISKKRVPEAVALAERALESAERIYQAGDLRLVKPVQDLGGALDYLGSLKESKIYFERALSIREAALGPDDPSLVDGLGNLASSLRQVGDYASATLLLERCLSILEKRKGNEDPALALALAELAIAHRFLWDLEVALAFAERSVRTLELAPVSEQGQLGRILGTKANVLHDMGRHLEARDVWERAIRLWTEQLGPKDGHVAWGLSAQALDLSGLGEHKRAREQAERALRIWSEQVDPNDRTLVLFLWNMADVLINEGNDARAKPLLERAVRLRELAYGPTHPVVAPLLDALSRVEYRLGHDAEAFEHALRSEPIVREDFLRTAYVLSERQVYQFERSLFSSLQVVLSALSRGKVESDSVGRTWEELVRSRALVLDELTSRHRAATLGEGPEVAALSSELRAVRSRLASLAMGSAGGTPIDGMAQVQARKESIERELSRLSSEHRRQVEERSVGLAAIRSALPEGAALLAYVEFAMVSVPQKGPHGVTTAGSDSHLGAFVLSASSPEPTFIRLGPTRETEPLILQWRKRAGEVPASLEPPLGLSEERYRNDGRLLREKVWDPLLPALRGVRTLFIVPDGALQLVSFATLPVGQDRYLVETGPLLHYLSAERDLVVTPGESIRGLAP